MSAVLDALPVLLNLWKSVLPPMFLGCFLGNLFLNTPLMQHLGRVMRPLARLGNLPAGVDTPLTLCLVNRVAAYSMLAELKNNGIVGVQEVVFSFLVSSLPKGFYYTVFYFAPVVLGSLGMHLGAIYLSVYFSIFALVGFVGLMMGRVFLTPGDGLKGWEDSPHLFPEPWWNKTLGAAKRSLPTFGRLIAVFVPVTFLVITLMQTETVKQGLTLVDPVLRQFGLPAPVLIVITTGLISMVAAIGTLGPMLQAGTVTPPEAIAALLFASALHYLYEFWSDDIPINISIFGPELGGKVSLANLVVLECATCLALVAATFF